MVPPLSNPAVGGLKLRRLSHKIGDGIQGKYFDVLIFRKIFQRKAIAMRLLFFCQKTRRLCICPLPEDFISMG